MPRIGYRGHPADESGIQSLFATDLFLCFQIVFRTIEAEVPVVNKPRRACLYVLFSFCFENSKRIFLYQSSFLVVLNN
jgi:hypothetical protein